VSPLDVGIGTAGPLVAVPWYATPAALLLAGSLVAGRQS
jgi:hypothetical protein